MNKKELGQHWLHDEHILQAIVEAGEVNETDYVLEIGPGKGTLTKKLLDTGANILAVELDQDLVPELKSRFAYCETFAITESDIRTFDYSTLSKDYKIIANIPYYLTSHLIRQLTEAENKPAIAVLLVQKEVAERICAKPGSMSTLSCVAQYWFECILDVEVPAEYFTPPPKVDSQVVIMKRREQPIIDAPFETFTEIISAGFAQKRKKLSNSLQNSLHLSKQQVSKLLETAEIDGSDRAQHLSFDEWGRLVHAYRSLQK